MADDVAVVGGALQVSELALDVSSGQSAEVARMRDLLRTLRRRRRRKGNGPGTVVPGPSCRACCRAVVPGRVSGGRRRCAA
ncbi:hypothetical protein ENKNEFLB_00663 [Nocardioides aquaticus]|uniref:Uncharacterized protein n=2 Tax=Nocardioides aquaticus TaxID=160826 RepID=A0ABX8EEE2_9ACTN|nr:hypothetical protein [Nocardioides aquaticus]QVT78290.1 hypothetical protein ENKNEFLB_00663 [Nocardioides aquaticus]